MFQHTKQHKSVTLCAALNGKSLPLFQLILPSLKGGVLTSKDILMKKLASLLTVTFTSLGLMAAPMAMAAPQPAPAKHQAKKAPQKKKQASKKKAAPKKAAKKAPKRAAHH